MKVYFDTIGCRLNQAEIEMMAAQFKSAGHEIMETADEADLVIVNSCTVTTEAASDSRQKIRQANWAGARQIIVTGCLATMEPVEIGKLQGVTRSISNQEKNQLPKLLLGEEISDHTPPARKPIPGIHRRTRAFIKAQDGCNNFCTFCITRVARGRSISQSKEEVLELVQAAQAGGTKEIVLSGVNLGAWGRERNEGETLQDLIRNLQEHSSIERIRLSSLEPWDLDEGFFKLWTNRRLCRHIHLPLQSGSASVLNRMVRNTTPENFRAIVQLARKEIPDVAITTDIIVGFPGETDQEFEESRNFVEEMEFSGGHVFRYSKREGTAAARLGGSVHGKIAAERSRNMRTVLKISNQKYLHQQVGKAVSVLWEGSRMTREGKWQLQGLSDNYIRVRCESIEDRYNQIDQVRLQSVENGSIHGVLVMAGDGTKTMM
jgi:threonylcarbamoyladenosine tRNA methylthiotransferase MtaB